MASVPASAHEFSEADRAALRDALNVSVLHSLRPVAAILGTLLLLWAFDHAQRPRSIAVPLISVALGTALLLLVFTLVFKRLRLPARFANAVGALIAGMLSFHRLLSIALTLEPEQTTSLLLILVGSGFMLLSTPWLLAVIVGTLGAWLGIALGAAQWHTWRLFGFELLSASALALMLHAVRRRSLLRQEDLRRQNRRRNQELERQAVRLQTLIAVGQSINAELDLDALLSRVVDLIQESFGYYYVGIFRPEESGEFVVSRAGSGESGRRLTRAQFRLRVGQQGLIGWVARHRQVAYAADVTQDARYVGSDTVPDTRSELVLPLETGGMFLGVLDIQSVQLDAFAEDDIQVLRSLAHQVAIAIENAESYAAERSRRVLSETLYEVGRALSRTLDPREVLGMILEYLVRLVPFDRGSVMLRHGDELEMVSARGFPEESNPLQIRVRISADDVFEQIAHSRQPLIEPDVLQRPDWQQVPGLPQARSWTGVPLVDAEGAVIAMLSLTRETPHPFAEAEVELAVAFAGHAAVALQNARLYAQLAQAYEQLERLDRTKSDFITVASHELRTPLTLLQGFSSILLKDPVIQASSIFQEMVGGIQSGALRLHEIVESMVDMAKIDSRSLQLYIEPVVLSELLGDLAGNFNESLRERSLALTLEVDESLPVVPGDSETLRKVFRHLMMNAIKYTPDGGRITVRARARPELPAQALPSSQGREPALIQATASARPGSERDVPPAGQVSAPSNGQAAVLSHDRARSVEVVVRDTGIGIDPQYHDLIFGKFYQTGEVKFHSSGTTKFKGGGPGLGLAIAKGIVESHGGVIWVESPGHDEETCPGSSFYVVLPLQSPQPSPA